MMMQSSGHAEFIFEREWKIKAIYLVNSAQFLINSARFSNAFLNTFVSQVPKTTVEFVMCPKEEVMSSAKILHT